MARVEQDPLKLAMERSKWAKKQIKESEAMTGKPKQISKSGRWLVPPAERPAGWEKLGLLEPFVRPEKQEGI